MQTFVQEQMQLTDLLTIALVTPNNDQMVDGLISKYCESVKTLNRKDDVMYLKYAIKRPE